MLRARVNAARFVDVIGDGLAEVGVALRGAVVRPAFVQRLFGGGDNVGRRFEIRLADLQVNNALSLRFQGAGLHQYFEGGFD